VTVKPLDTKQIKLMGDWYDAAGKRYYCTKLYIGPIGKWVVIGRGDSPWSAIENACITLTHVLDNLRLLNQSRYEYLRVLRYFGGVPQCANGEMSELNTDKGGEA